MKHYCYAKTSSGSISEFYEADNIKAAERIMAFHLKEMGWEEVVGRQPSFSEFLIIRKGNNFIKIKEDNN